MQRFIRMVAALAVFAIATGMVPVPQGRATPLVASVQTAAAIDLCSFDQTAPGCPGDPCVIDPASFECTGDPCSADMTAPGCPDDPCVIDPASFECTGDPCSADMTAPGCPDEPSTLTITKFGSFSPNCADCADGQSAADFIITVANTGADVNGVSLVEALALPNHTTFVSAEITEHEINNGGPPAVITLNALWNGTTEPSLTDGEFTAPADSDLVFEVHIVFGVAAALTAAEANCPTGGVDNTVTVWRNGQALTDAGACVSMAGELQFAKTVADHTYDPDTGSYTITYNLSAYNSTPIPTTFSLVDAPGLSPSVIVADVSLTDEQSGDVSVLDITAAPFTIATDVAIAGGAEYDYLLAITYAIDPFSDSAGDDMICDGAAGLGLFNSLSGTYPDGGKPSVVSACADVPAPNLQFDKQFVGSTVVDADTLSAVFEITVTNALVDGELVGTAVYQIIDAPVATMGITPGALQLVSVDGGVEGDDYMAEVVAFLGGVDALTAEGLLDPGATHVYHVSIDYDFDIVGGFSGACGAVQVDQTPPGGMFNVLITDPAGLVGGDPALDPETGLPFGFHVACGGAASVGFQKTVVNDDGGTLEPEDVVFDIKGADGAVVETAHDGETVALPAGEYAVDEEPVPGYTSDGTTCGLVGEVIGAAVGPIVPGATTFAAGEDYLCSAINNDLPVDLAIGVDDGDAELVAGGAPATYTITVTNNGRAVPAGDVVSLTTELPDGLSIVEGSIDCTTTTVATNHLACDLDAGDLGAGDSVVVTFQAHLPADGASGTHWIVSYVTTDADPVLPAIVCDLTEPAQVNPHGADNAACESTPAIREATMSATKVSDATGPKTAGDLVTYTLTTTNHGPSTLLSGSTVTDDLPLGVELVSITAPGWLCGNADPVVCTYDQAIGVGETAPAVQIVTKVTATGAGTINNVGVFVGILDVELGQPVNGLRAQALPRVVTATATASAIASITVTKSGAGGGGGGGGLPSTGGSPLELLYIGLGLVLTGGVVLRARHQGRVRHHA